MLNVKLNFVGQWDVQGSFAKNIKGSSDNKSSIISNINFSHLWNFSSPLNSKGLMKPVDDKEAKKKKKKFSMQEEMNYWFHYSLPVRHSLTPELYSMLRSLSSYLEQNCQVKRFLDTPQEQCRDNPRVIREFRYKIIQHNVVCNL